MSAPANLQTYTWSYNINGQFFEILVNAKDVEEARKEVLGVFTEIERIKPEYAANLVTIDAAVNQNDRHTATHLFGENNRLCDSVPADFTANYMINSFDYTADKIMNNRDPSSMTLSEFIHKTEPRCRGLAHPVSFRSFPEW